MKVLLRMLRKRQPVFHHRKVFRTVALWSVYNLTSCIFFKIVLIWRGKKQAGE